MGYILSKKSVKEISSELSLPIIGTEQDWDIELADSSRISEFLDYYRNNDFSVEKRIAVMELLIASYDDFLNVKDSEVDSRWKEIKSILKSEKIIFKELVYYWASFEDEVDQYQISPLLRDL